MKNSVNEYLISHHHTAICVGNWEKSVRFYNSFGFVVENDWFWPEGTKNHKSLLRFQNKDNCWIELFEYPEGAGRFTEQFRMSAGSVYNYIMEVCQKRDVDEFFFRTVENGGREVVSPHAEKWHGKNADVNIYLAEVAGPDGEIIGFQWNSWSGLKESGVKGFGYQTLWVSKIEQSIEFYERLGFVLQDIYTKEGAENQFALMLMGDGSGILLKEGGKGKVPTDKERLQTPGTLFQYCFWLDKSEGIDAIYGYCVGMGVEERIRPFWHDGYGMKHWVDHPAFVYGPDNEILEFLYIDYKGNR